MFDAAGKQSAGLHHLVAGIVNGGRGVINGSDDAELIGELGGFREDVRNLHAGNFGADRSERTSHFGRSASSDGRCRERRSPCDKRSE